MAYGSRSNMEALFGTERIKELADYDETGESADIATAITNALAHADDIINSRMRQSHLRVPLVTSAGATPELVANIANRLAAGWLARQWRLESVPPGEAGERVLAYEQEAMGELNAIASGKLRLDAI